MDTVDAFLALLGVLMLALLVLAPLALYWRHQARYWKRQAAYERAAAMEMASETANAWETGLMAGPRQARDELVKSNARISTTH